VLMIGLGQATRLVEYVQRMPKTYLATFQLGRASDTEDIEGNIVVLAKPPVPTEEQLLAALPSFLGTIQQMPPAFSALKVAGRRAYDLARQGQAVELAARPVEIHSLDLLHYAYPEMQIRIRCGSGTYVRSLGRDLARSLGTEAVMSALRREAIGPFRAEEAIPANALSLETIKARLMPPILAVGVMPRIALGEDEIRRLSQGQEIESRGHAAGSEIAALDQSARLVAILTVGDRGTLKTAKFFGPA
jgi:tRNA pseudouridine55 synthase